MEVIRIFDGLKNITGRGEKLEKEETKLVQENEDAEELGIEHDLS